MRRAAAALLIAIAPAIFAQTKIKSGWNLFTTQQDVEIGQKSLTEALKQTPLLNDPQIDAYVDGIGQRLVVNAGGPKFQYQFRVVNSSDINAFALPGGFIFVNRGILENARNDGEVAGVLAHEISHVALRHGTHQASKAYAAQAGIAILGGIVGGKVGQNTAEIIDIVGGVGLNALFLKYSRDLESQADVRGAQIAAATGYSPDDMVNFFKTLEKVDKAKKTSWLSDHPAPPDRIARIQREEQLLQVSATPNRNTAQLAVMQARLDGIAVPKKGQPTVPSSQVPAASAAFRSYESKSGAYRISYPDNWQVQEEGNTGVTFFPPNGIASAYDVRYGAVLNVYSGGGASLENATEDLISRVRQASPYLEIIDGSGQRLSLEDGVALAAALRGRNPQTAVDEHVTVVTRPLQSGNLVYLLFVTPESEVSNARDVLNRMVRSMQVATTVH